MGWDNSPSQSLLKERALVPDEWQRKKRKKQLIFSFVLFEKLSVVVVLLVERHA